MPKGWFSGIVFIMGAATVEQLAQEARTVVRNLPDAHASWQFWRNSHFRRDVGAVVEAVYALPVEGLSDEDLEVLEKAVKYVIRVVDVHTATLGLNVRDTVDREYFRDVIAKLSIALEGLEQGFSPDPAKRPSDDQLMDRLAAGLTRAKLA